jgi:hypothetical protein
MNLMGLGYILNMSGKIFLILSETTTEHARFIRVGSLTFEQLAIQQVRRRHRGQVRFHEAGREPHNTSFTCPGP